MINKEEFELHKSIIDWMRSAGVPFLEAVSTVSLATQTERSIPECYMDIQSHWTIKDEKKDD